MNFDTQNKSITEMTDEELMEHIKDIRARRRNVARRPAKKKTSSGGPLRGVNAETARKLLEMMGEDVGDE